MPFFIKNREEKFYSVIKYKLYDNRDNLLFKVKSITWSDDLCDEYVKEFNSREHAIRHLKSEKTKGTIKEDDFCTVIEYNYNQSRFWNYNFFLFDYPSWID